jgi:hypothetical protein
MAHPTTTTVFTLFACVGARCSISMQTRTLNLLPHLCKYGRERSSCLSHPELVIIAAKHKVEKRQGLMMQTTNATGAINTGSTAMHALAVGAFALGAVAIGAIAVGAMAIGRLRVLEARIEKLSIGTLTVDHLNVRSR